MAITRTLTKTFKTITRSRSSPFLRKTAQDEEDDEASITPLQPSVPPPKALRLDIDLSDTLNLDFHQLDFSDDTQLEAWTAQHTPKTATEATFPAFVPQQPFVDNGIPSRKSVLAPESVSNGFFESLGSSQPLPRAPVRTSSTPTIRPPNKRQMHPSSAGSNIHGVQANQSPPLAPGEYRQRHASHSAVPDTPPRAAVRSPSDGHSRHKKAKPARGSTTSGNGFLSSNRDSTSGNPRDHMRQSKSCSNLTSARHPVSPQPIVASQFVKQVPAASTTTLDSFATCTDKPLPAIVPAGQNRHSPSYSYAGSVASVDTVSAYIDPTLASTISSYYHAFPPVEDSPITPSLDDRNSSSTFTMSPSTMSTPSLVDSPSSTCSYDGGPASPSKERSALAMSAMPPSRLSSATPPLNGLNVPFNTMSLYSTDGDLVPPPRSKYRSRHYRFDSNASSCYSSENTSAGAPISRSRDMVKEDYMGALRHSLYGSISGSRDSHISTGCRPGSAYVTSSSGFDIPQLGADDYAQVIKEGQWF